MFWRNARSKLFARYCANPVCPSFRRRRKSRIGPDGKPSAVRCPSRKSSSPHACWNSTEPWLCQMLRCSMLALSSPHVQGTPSRSKTTSSSGRSDTASMGLRSVLSICSLRSVCIAPHPGPVMDRMAFCTPTEVAAISGCVMTLTPM